MSLRLLGSSIFILIAVFPGTSLAQNIHEAAREGDAAAVRRLIEQDPESVNAIDEQLRAPLHWAASAGHADVANILLDHGARLGARDRYGWTPLHYAAEHGRVDVSGLLILRGAEVNTASTGGYTPLTVAQMYEADSVALLLREHGSVSSPAVTGRVGPWFGEEAPGAEPRVFALDLVSSSHHEHGTVTFSSDGEEAFWESYGRILTSQLTEGGWTRPYYAAFSADTGNSGDVPFLSPNGERLYFISQRPTNAGGEGGVERIWVVARTEAGWSEPSVIEGGPNVLGVHWQFSVAANGNIYFGSGVPGEYGGTDIYVSRLVNGVYQDPENLGAVINSEAWEFSPFIAPDESYIIVTGSAGPDARGGTDLYIAFQTPGNTWTEPLNMGELVNTSASDMCPQVSGDGRYLFWNTRFPGNYDNFWMSASIIEDLRAEAFR